MLFITFPCALTAKGLANKIPDPLPVNPASITSKQSSPSASKSTKSKKLSWLATTTEAASEFLRATANTPESGEVSKASKSPLVPTLAVVALSIIPSLLASVTVSPDSTKS